MGLDYASVNFRFTKCLFKTLITDKNLLVHLRPMLKLKDYSAIIFDLGGVIINLDYQATVREFKRLGLKNFEAVFSKAQQAELADRFERGEINPDHFFEEISRIGCLTNSRKELENAWNAMLLDIPIERLELIEEIRKKIPVFLLSNTNLTHTLAYNRILENTTGKTSLNPWFNKIYLSYEVGKRKPEARIFQQVIDDNGLNPSSTLFIDDSPQHIVGARQVGLQTHHLEDGQDIRNLFFL